MIGLYAFWFAIVVGAGLFFAAGVVASRRRQVVDSMTLQSERDQAQEWANNALQEQSAAYQQELAGAKQAYDELSAAKAELEQAMDEQETNAEKTLVETEQGRAAQRRKVAELRAAHEAELANAKRSLATVQAKLDKALPKVSTLEQQLSQAKQRIARTEQGATKSVQGLSLVEEKLGQTEQELNELQRELARSLQELAQMGQELAGAESTNAGLHSKLAIAREDAGHLADAQIAIADLKRSYLGAKDEVGDRNQTILAMQAEMESLRGKVKEGEAWRRQVVVLRTQAVDSKHHEEQISELSQTVDSLKAQQLALVEPLPVTAVTQAGGADSSLRERLLGVINAIGGEVQSNAIVIADRTGLPVVTAGEHGTELAAYASLVSDVAGRASQFVPMAAPDHVDFVDKNGTTISVWPFNVEAERLSLITLSNTKSAKAELSGPTIRGAVANMASIMKQEQIN